MRYGVVKSKRQGMFNTPNKGLLIDLLTGVEYPFSRPDLAFGEVPKDWNLEKHDIISFDLVNGVVTDVTLHKKHVQDVVYYKSIT